MTKSELLDINLTFIKEEFLIAKVILQFVLNREINLFLTIGIDYTQSEDDCKVQIISFKIIQLIFQILKRKHFFLYMKKYNLRH